MAAPTPGDRPAARAGGPGHAPPPPALMSPPARFPRAPRSRAARLLQLPQVGRLDGAAAPPRAAATGRRRSCPRSGGHPTPACRRFPTTQVPVARLLHHPAQHRHPGERVGYRAIRAFWPRQTAGLRARAPASSSHPRRLHPLPHPHLHPQCKATTTANCPAISKDTNCLRCDGVSARRRECDGTGRKERWPASGASSGAAGLSATPCRPSANAAPAGLLH